MKDVEELIKQTNKAMADNSSSEEEDEEEDS